MRLQLLEANFDCFVFNGVVCVLVVIDIIVWKLISYELPYCVFFLCFFFSVWVARRPPGYAFIDFDDRRDAEDAIREIDGMTSSSIL